MKKTAVFLISLSLFTLSFQTANTEEPPVLEKSVMNMSGGNKTMSNASQTLTSSNSIGEMLIGQGNGDVIVQAGFFNEFVMPTPTATPTPLPTSTPIPTATALQDFEGKIISKKYTYFAPNPVQGKTMNFVVWVKQACEIEAKLYTTTNRLVLSFNFTCPGEGKYEHQEYVGNLANGAYLLLVKAKTQDGKIKERLIKKMALIK